MPRSAHLLLLPALAAGACAAPLTAPSLAPRAAEGIDPRVPVAGPVTDRAADPALSARLADLVTRARSGDSDFQSALAEARRLAAVAGGPQTDGWIAAQQALSAAVAARAPTTHALGDIDALAAEELARSGGIGTGDYLAIQQALAEVAAIDARQSASVDTLQRQLGG